MDNLAFGISHEAFEQALDDLAVMIGFVSQRPDHDVKRGPDVLWRLTEGRHLLFECKNQANLDRIQIYKKEAEQLGHHITWFKQEYPSETYTPVSIRRKRLLTTLTWKKELS